MPIGKNAIKRVENNGYSKVESKAPDMENSTVIANLDAQVVEKLVTPVEKKTAAKKAPATKKTAQKKEAVPAVVEKQTKSKCVKKAPTKKNGFARVELGGEMPYYLL